MKLHVKRHLEVIRERCTVCSKTFRGKYELNKHKRIQHDNFRYNCDECSKTFRSYSGMKYHKTKVHIGSVSVVDSECFSCDLCKKRYSTRSNLLRHNCCYTKSSNKLNDQVDFNVATGNVFMCIKCEPTKRFKQVRYLKEHEKSFHNKRELLCNICKAVFVTRSARLYHCRTIHDTK